PHRELARQARQRQFVTLAIAAAVAGFVIVGLVHLVLVARIDDQLARNNLLKTRIVELDRQISEIDKLKDQIQQVLARKQVVENLQANRNEAVHLLDQLVKQLPEGTYLHSVRQVGDKVTIVGYAQSNARVSTLIRNIDGSPWLEKPELVEIKLVTVAGPRKGEAIHANQFTLNFLIKHAQPVNPPPALRGKGARQ
ncbi:MAG: PilN domain-containing protein, partial [Casimicrobiaceae bacterium]